MTVIKMVNFQYLVQVDNRVSSHGTSAPLLPILHRFGAVPPLKAPSSSPPLWDDNMPLEVFFHTEITYVVLGF